MSTKKRTPRCGYGRKDWRYMPGCGCCRCSIERVVFAPAMARLQA